MLNLGEIARGLNAHLHRADANVLSVVIACSGVLSARIRASLLSSIFTCSSSPWTCTCTGLLDDVRDYLFQSCDSFNTILGTLWTKTSPTPSFLPFGNLFAAWTACAQSRSRQAKAAAWNFGSLIVSLQALLILRYAFVGTTPNCYRLRCQAHPPCFDHCAVTSTLVQRLFIVSCSSSDRIEASPSVPHLQGIASRTSVLRVLGAREPPAGQISDFPERR